MLYAERSRTRRRAFDIAADGHPVATYDPGWGRTGRLFVAGAEYTIRRSGWGGRDYTMTAGNDAIVATASRVGGKYWTVQADGREYHFRRQSLFSKNQMLMLGEQQVGVVSRPRTLRLGAEADLPGLSPLAQAFVVAVVLSLWRQQSANAGAAAAAGGAAAGGGG